MARKNLFNIADADAGRPGFNTPGSESAQPEPLTISQPIDETDIRRRQPYREGKRAVMFFLSEEAFSQMHVLLARQGRRKVQSLMEELVDDWFRRENAPRVVK
ncbi:hypothetical protein [Falsiroseomonas sp. E2-1-a20]|uniref:hypothetical protein n=1 Tax=Falsiroseomonas sp. E2-1-a20 TaxID=3239300 RepID=UPI003F40A25D